MTSKLTVLGKQKDRQDSQMDKQAGRQAEKDKQMDRCREKQPDCKSGRQKYNTASHALRGREYTPNILSYMTGTYISLCPFV